MTNEEKMDKAIEKMGDAVTAAFTLMATKSAEAIAEVADAFTKSLKGK